MGLAYHFENLIELIDKPGPEWDRCEATLNAGGALLPLYHRAAWARALARSDVGCSLITVRADDGDCLGALAFESAPSRVLPGHRLLSVQRLGIGAGGLDEPGLAAALGELCRIARQRPVLRVTVDVFALDAESRERTGDALRRAGFMKVPTTRSYERTLVMDLGPSEESLFAGLHKNARQGVRNIARYPVRVTTATAETVAARLQALSDATRARTGGDRRTLDWPSIIALSSQSPELSRIAVLERTDLAGPDAVLAFAWGCMHGDVCEYSESGSSRVTDLKVSTSYSLLWDLIVWARRGGARWFDLGGVTPGVTHSDDPLGGISDFKRRFSQRELEVGEQWQLEPRPLRAWIAQLLSRGAGLVRNGIERMRP